MRCRTTSTSTSVSSLRGIIVGLLLATALAACRGDTPAIDDWRADPDSSIRISHAVWQSLLDHYVIVDADGLNRVDYAGLKMKDRDRLAAYLEAMADAPLTRVTRDEQMAFWINLYNALTVQLIVDHYPLQSILDIGTKLNGPWNRTLITIDGRALTLDDIEHRILRGSWQEPRIHFAVNCASVGCPNLQPAAFLAETLEAQLADAAREFLGSARAVNATDGTLKLSSLFDWYAADFGDSPRAVRERLAGYADPATAALLRDWSGPVVYDYDWSLNAATR